jgi:HAD superfamily hydrolase (TIGR01450 family)
VTATIVCDLDGVVYLGDQEVPGAGTALRSLHEAGFRLLFATNNSSRTRADGAAKITRLTGYETDRSQVVSSATAAGAMLAGTSAPALVVGGPGVIEALTDAGIIITDDPYLAGVVVVGLDVDLTYEKLARATRAVRNGARLVATNLDATYPTPIGLLPGAGSIVAALERATGVTAEAAGKPFPPMRSILAAMADSGPVWMVGDRADTDLAMADLEGWTSVLVLTGVAEGPEGIDPAPHVVLDSLADLPAHLGV